MLLWFESRRNIRWLQKKKPYSCGTGNHGSHCTQPLLNLCTIVSFGGTYIFFQRWFGKPFILLLLLFGNFTISFFESTPHTPRTGSERPCNRSSIHRGSTNDRDYDTRHSSQNGTGPSRDGNDSWRWRYHGNVAVPIDKCCRGCPTEMYGNGKQKSRGAGCGMRHTQRNCNSRQHTSRDPRRISTRSNVFGTKCCSP